jgi:hypothetical protein
LRGKLMLMSVIAAQKSSPQAQIDLHLAFTG